MINERRRGQANDYPYVRAWGHYMGTPDLHVRDALHDARDSTAPADAVYRSFNTHEWITIGEIAPDGMRRQLHVFAQNAWGAALPPPQVTHPRCDALVGSRDIPGVCEQRLDQQGRCHNAGRHLPSLPR